MVKKCDDKTKIYNEQTKKCIKFNSPYFKKLLNEQKVNGTIFFSNQELKEFSVKSPSVAAKPPSAVAKPPSVAAKPPSVAAKPPSAVAAKPPSAVAAKPVSIKKELGTPQLKNVNHLISYKVQNKLKSYIEKLKKNKKNKITKSVSDMCFNNKLLDIPIVHKHTTTNFTFYQFTHLIGNSLNPKNMETFFDKNLNKTRISTLGASSLRYYENNFNPVYLYAEKNNEPLDIEWFNELNKYMKKLDMKDLLNLHTYTKHGDKIINNFLLAESPLDFVKKYINTNINEKILDYTKDVIFPLFVPFVKFVSKLKKKYNNDNDRILSILFKKVDEKEFDTFKDKIFRDPMAKILIKPIPKESFKTISQKFITNNSMDFSTYYASLLLISFVKPVHLISIMKLYAEGIQTVINNSPKTKKPMTLYRGAKDDYIFKQKKGIYFKNKTFISSTIDYSVSNRFSGNSCCLTYITILPGSQLLWLAGLSAYNEFLLGLNTTFMIRSHQKEYVRKLEDAATIGNIKICDSLKTSYQKSSTITKVVAL
jgi:hypothetical protein